VSCLDPLCNALDTINRQAFHGDDSGPPASCHVEPGMSKSARAPAGLAGGTLASRTWPRARTCATGSSFKINRNHITLISSHPTPSFQDEARQVRVHTFSRIRSRLTDLSI
jgi:hypothetical protein